MTTPIILGIFCAFTAQAGSSHQLGAPAMPIGNYALPAPVTAPLQLSQPLLPISGGLAPQAAMPPVSIIPLPVLKAEGKVPTAQNTPVSKSTPLQVLEEIGRAVDNELNHGAMGARLDHFDGADLRIDTLHLDRTVFGRELDIADAHGASGATLNRFEGVDQQDDQVNAKPITAKNIPGNYILTHIYGGHPDVPEHTVKFVIQSDGRFIYETYFVRLDGRWTLNNGVFSGLYLFQEKEFRFAIDFNGIRRNEFTKNYDTRITIRSGPITGSPNNFQFYQMVETQQVQAPKQ